MFICLVINMMANKIAYISDVPIISFNQLLNEKSKLLPTEKNKYFVRINELKEKFQFIHQFVM